MRVNKETKSMNTGFAKKYILQQPGISLNICKVKQATGTGQKTPTGITVQAPLQLAYRKRLELCRCRILLPP